MLAADGNGNHVVDAADYSIWRDHLGATLGSGSGLALPSAKPLSAGVPEPATVGLLIVGILAMVSLLTRERVINSPSAVATDGEFEAIEIAEAVEGVTAILLFREAAVPLAHRRG